MWTVVSAERHRGHLVGEHGQVSHVLGDDVQELDPLGVTVHGEDAVWRLRAPRRGAASAGSSRSNSACDPWNTSPGNEHEIGILSAISRRTARNSWAPTSTVWRSERTPIRTVVAGTTEIDGGRVGDQSVGFDVRGVEADAGRGGSARHIQPSPRG